MSDDSDFNLYALNSPQGVLCTFVVCRFLKDSIKTNYTNYINVHCLCI